MKLTDRQIKLLKCIVEEYVENPEPISSSIIVSKYMKKVSSATIRNEMVILEKNDLLEKNHVSSGRIPSVKAFKYYNEFIVKPEVNNLLKSKLNAIFNNRDLSINTIIEQTTDIIQQTFQMPIFVSNEDDSESLKKIDLVKIDDKTAVVLVVTSLQNINKNVLTFDSSVEFDDIVTCIKIFNSRLIDTPLKLIPQKAELLKPLLRKTVQKYEFCVRQIFENIFSFSTQKIQQPTKVKGLKFLTSYREFQDIEALNKVLSFLEDTNVWKHISYIEEATGKTSIIFENEIGVRNLAIASTSFEIGETKQRFSIVGPSRMNYGNIKGALEYIKEQLENYFKK
ncbi:MAG: heat-inducible transcriptional repressor HrcA [Mycoplasmataceae bacterium]|nr:heat-inducible transcriptional repressor HrcA [Mycoplasmataceae bacterium]